MSLTCGFFNAVNGVPAYDASDFSKIFNGIINDGIFMSVGDHFSITPGADMSVRVGTGRAWFNGTWTHNDAAFDIPIELGDPLLSRIDRVVLEVNELDSVRDNTIKVLAGTPALTPVAPTVTKNSYVHQYALADIRVNKLATAITQADITNYIGTTEAPYVTGILQTIDATQLIAQWQSQWTNWITATDNWMNGKETEINEWEETFKAAADLYMDDRQDDFDTWFEHIRGQLDTDQAGHLQNELNDANDRLDSTDASVEDLYFHDRGLISATTTFLSNGNVRVEESSGAVTLTSFNSDGSITDTYTKGDVTKTHTVTFNADGSITEVVV